MCVEEGKRMTTAIAPSSSSSTSQPADRLTTTIVEEPDGRVVVRATGFLDVYTASGFRQQLDRRVGDCDVLLDLTGVIFIDAAGIGLLLSIANRIGRHGCRVAVLCTEAIAGAVGVAGLNGTVSLVHRTP